MIHGLDFVHAARRAALAGERRTAQKIVSMQTAAQEAMTSPGGPKPRLLAPVVHPLCFALLPILLLYTGNLADVRLWDLWLPALLALAAGTAVWWLSVRVTRARPRGAVLASLFWLWFFTCSHWQSWFAPQDALAEAVSPMLYAVPLVVIVAFLAGTRRDFRHPSNVLNLVGIVLVALQAMTIGQYEVKRLRHHFGPPTSQVTARARAASVKPHIFFIVLDGYARADVLVDIYHHSNQPFLDLLHSRGFQVAKESRTNYAHTQPSLSSCLNLDYLQALADEEHPLGRLDLPELIANNRTFSFLRKQGYQIVPFPSGYWATELPSSEAWHPPKRTGQFSEFETALISLTPLSLLLRPQLTALDADHERAEIVLYNFTHVASVARSHRPTFVFAHIVCPHPPFIFRRDGSMKSAGGGLEFRGRREAYLKAYYEQVEFVNARVQKLVDDILVAAERPTAIVIMSDHGPGSRLDWNHLEKTDLREKFSTLVAVRLPDGAPGKLDDHITTVNVLRFALSECLGADLPPFPSRSYFSNYTRPLSFTLVTDEQGRFRQFAPSPTGKGR